MNWDVTWQSLCEAYHIERISRAGMDWSLVPLAQFEDWMRSLAQQKTLGLDMLLDIAVVDYLHFGLEEWKTQTATSQGYSRGVLPLQNLSGASPSRKRFAVLYQLLSIQHNRRVSVKVEVNEGESVPSMVPFWPSAQWLEREGYDLYGLVISGPPDLRRLLTDYDFEGHPFLKDFPMEGQVEMRYDGKKEQCVYEPVSIESRVTVPKVIRNYDNRYQAPAEGEES